MKDVTLKYDVLSHITVINKLSLQIDSGKKIGIIGGPGSGKHSIFSLLLNLFTKEKTEGTCLQIYGQDIESINPFDLRKNIMYLSKYPVLFSGKIRDNIDPLDNIDENLMIYTLSY